jgi:hypothetical protein
MEDEKTDKGFVVKDRRLFDEAGDDRNEETARTDDASEAQNGPLPDVNFASFIFSLSTTALFHFGDFPDPATNETQRNLPAAKQTIDILSILKDKTEGNLDQDEKEFLEGILYELRMRYVKEMAVK